VNLVNFNSALKEGYEILKESGIEDAKNDAYLLLEKATDRDKGYILAHPERELSDTEYETYLRNINERAKRLPLQHILGTEWFMGLEFLVNSDVLIPRPDTECLVEEVLKELSDGMDILDMCTGSGCILTSLLYYSNNCNGVGVDISDKALKIAQKNAQNLLKDKKNIGFSYISSDMFGNISGKFDIIVSNPPYIRTEEIMNLEPEVSLHDPYGALDGGEDGLDFYRVLAKEGREHLKEFGMIFLEIGFDQAGDVSKLLKIEGYKDIKTVKDYSGNDRVVCARKAPALI